MNNENIPNHVGLILDGNRRWAADNDLPKLEGHRVGYENLKTISDHAFERGVKYVSAYIFSSENWNRSKNEVNYLMGLLPIVFKKYVKDAIKKGIRLHWLGSREKLSTKQIDLIDDALERTKHLDKAHLCFCFNYGGRQEIADALKKLISEGVHPDDVTTDFIADNLYEPEVPDIDLVIRTSGEQRLSNFMLWRTAYSELLFVDKHWPAFTTEDFDNALIEYNSRNRRFGL